MCGANDTNLVKFTLRSREVSTFLQGVNQLVDSSARFDINYRPSLGGYRGRGNLPATVEMSELTFAPIKNPHALDGLNDLPPCNASPNRSDYRLGGLHRS